jgi:hypothetical protein
VQGQQTEVLGTQQWIHVPLLLLALVVVEVTLLPLVLGLLVVDNAGSSARTEEKRGRRLGRSGRGRKKEGIRARCSLHLGQAGQFDS